MCAFGVALLFMNCPSLVRYVVFVVFVVFHVLGVFLVHFVIVSEQFWKTGVFQASNKLNFSCPRTEYASLGLPTRYSFYFQEVEEECEEEEIM